MAEESAEVGGEVRKRFIGTLYESISRRNAMKIE